MKFPFTPSFKRLFIYKHSPATYKLLHRLCSAKREDTIRVLYSKLLREVDKADNPYKLLREIEIIMTEKEKTLIDR